MRNLYLSLALLVLLASIFAPTPPGLERDGTIMLGIFLMAVILWLTEAIPMAATGLLIILLQPLLGVENADEVFSSFGNSAVFFILASFMIAAAMEKHGLHKRMAARMLSFFGHSPRTFIFAVMLTGALLSFIMISHGVAALLLPMLLHVMLAVRAVPKKSNFGTATMLALAYGTTVGSWGTLLGGARNPLTLSFLEDMGYNLTFLDWMKMSMPVVAVVLPLLAVVLVLLYPPEKIEIERAIRDIKREIEGRKISMEEKTLSAIIIFTVILWFFFSDSIGIAVIALLSVMLLFLFNLMEWEDMEKRVQWGILLIYGGAITMGKGMESTGVALWMAGGITNIFHSPYTILFGIILLTFILTNLMSNTAAVATMLPISIGIANSAGISPVTAAMATALAGGTAFLFVIATPGMAIAYSSEYITQKDMLKAGMVAGLLSMMTIFLFAVFYWESLY